MEFIRKCMFFQSPIKSYSTQMLIKLPMICFKSKLFCFYYIVVLINVFDIIYVTFA